MSETNSALLMAGVARGEITPPSGIALVGFAGRGGGLAGVVEGGGWGGGGAASGVHDGLTATGLVLQSGEERAALVCCDLLGFPEGLVAEVREEVERRTGIPGGQVVLQASHTH